MELQAGNVRITVADDEQSMGALAAREAADAAVAAASGGKRIAFWMMAAPSGFAFYEAFVALAAAEPALARVLRESLFFQFDDYPIARTDPRFPITFRHLLETRLFGPLERAIGPLPGKRLLELRGDPGDEGVIEAYRLALLDVLGDPGRFVVEVKGIGMDGHWGFHGKETPLAAPPGLVRVPMNSLNIQQQLLDWPDYFSRESDVPATAVTGTVALFMMADLVLDLVPQEAKAFAVLACYGPETVSPLVPSSALKGHPNVRSFLTERSAAALVEYRASGRPGKPVSEATMERLRDAWRNPANPGYERRNVAEMIGTLGALFGG